MPNSVINRRVVFGKMSPYDPSAQAFIVAAAITDATQKTAINNLVVGLKANSLWSKMKALYPMVGGTASSHKYNLIDPRDLDAAFRLQFFGGWTHSSTGALSNGTNAYADTFLIPSTSLTGQNVHGSVYSRTSVLPPVPLDNYFYGVSYLGINMGLDVYMNTPKIYTLMPGATPIDVTITNTLGLLTTTVTNGGSNNHVAYRNAVSVGQNTSASSSLPAGSIFLGAYRNTGSPAQYCGFDCSYFSIGDGLTPTDVTNLNTLVQAFQTTLGRNV
jgi:hypothetical protein